MIRPHQPSATVRLGLLGLVSAILVPLAGRAETVFESWINRYNPDLGSSPSVHATAIAKDGSVAIAGFTYDNANHRIYYVAKYDGLTGNEVWARTFDSGQDSGDEANAVAFDSTGAVIVTGGADSASDNLDIVTIKYDKDGNFEWLRRYDSGTGGLDEGLFVAVNAANDVIVCGRSFIGSVSGEDIYTVKYNGSDGVTESEIRYTTSGTKLDSPRGLAIDGAGKVVVCGITTTALGDTDFYLAKYNMSTPVATADWTRIFGNDDDDEAHDVAVDSADNVIVTGLLENANLTDRFFTRKYDSTGGIVWSQSYPEISGDFRGGARGVAVDAAGNVFVTGVSMVGDNGTLYTAKSFAANGAIDWSVRSPIVEDDTDFVELSPGDLRVRIAVDPAGNPIIAGSVEIGSNSADYYVAKLSSLNAGAVIWEKFFKGGFPNEGPDRVADMAVDPFGNVVVTGDSLREAGILFEVVTVKYGTTALATGDTIVGNGVPENARIVTLSTPAAADTGAIAARVTLAAGKKRVGAIVTVGGGDGLALPAVQGVAAPGITGAEFKSFLDPVLAPDGRVAFIGKVSGVKGSESTGVWTTAFNLAGTLELALQSGKQVPGMEQGVLLRSISSISLRNGQLLALIKVSGKSAGVTKANSTVLYGLSDIGIGFPLMRTGDEITVAAGEEPTTIKSLTVFTPAKGSAGHGRYHGDLRAISRATLADKRSAILTALNNGTIVILTNTAKDASSMVAGAKWKNFGLPAIDTDGFRYATSGSLTIGEGDVDKGSDAIIGYSFNATNFVNVAREGSPANGFQNGNYASFLDPLVNENGRVAFLGTAKGSGVKGSNKTGIWFGLPGSVGLIARTNHPDFPATDGIGADIDAKWSSFTSLALPGGTGSGPLFLARISGKAASKKTNFGLWGVDSNGFVRKLIRNGDQLGDLSVRKFTVLQPSSGSVGATRSFSAGRTIAVLVNFSDKSTGIVNIGIP
jgi:hypothetical protein